MRIAAAAAMLAAALAACAAVALAADPRIATAIDPLTVAPAKSSRLALHLSAADAVALLATHSDIVLIDIRDRQFAVRDGPLGVPSQPVPFTITGAPQPDGRPGPAKENVRFAAQVRRILSRPRVPAVPATGRTLFLVCAIGVQSAIAADRLAEQGFTNVYTIVDGSVALREAAARARPAQ